jgi:hypothetical protein
VPAMPSGLCPDEGLAVPLAFWLQASVSGVIAWQCMLWVNDFTPDADTVLADLIEATWGGYSRFNLNRSTWTNPVVTAGCAVTTWGTSPKVWSVTGGPVQTIYGWAIVDTVAGELRWVQRLDDADIAPVEVGGQFSLLPRITGTNAPCAGDLSLLRPRPRARARKGKHA